MDKFSFVGNADVNAIEALYHQYLANPESVDATWSQFFQGFDFLDEVRFSTRFNPNHCFIPPKN